MRTIFRQGVAWAVVGGLGLLAGCNALFGVDDLAYGPAASTSSGNNTGSVGGAAVGGHAGSAGAPSVGGSGGKAGVGGAAGSAGTGGTGGFACGTALPPTATSCPLECNGGCSSGVCTIECIGDNACRDDTIQCPAGLDCELICTDNEACDRATITCPADHSCEVACSGDKACREATILCSTFGPCRLGCGTGTDICYNTELICGSNACMAVCTGSSAPTVSCDTSCLCMPCGG